MMSAALIAPIVHEQVQTSITMRPGAAQPPAPASGEQPQPPGPGQMRGRSS
jgi:hypothetical protein